MTHAGWRRPGRGLLGAIALLVGVTTATTRAHEPKKEPLHVAFTAGMFADVNLNDARAAITLWSDTIAKSRGLALAPTADVYDDLDRLRTAMDTGRAHLVGMSVEEFHRLGRPNFGTFLIGQRNGRLREEVLVLVRKGRFTSLADLADRSLVALEGEGYSMSQAWLAVTLRDAGLPDADTHFRSVSSVAKPARAVLPVYFGQQDACLVDRSAYDLMVELNPQLGRELVALATSPPMVTSLTLVDRRFSPSSRTAAIEALTALHETPRGQQVLSLFRLERLVVATPDDFEVALEILDRPQRQRRQGARP